MIAYSAYAVNYTAWTLWHLSELPATCIDLAFPTNIGTHSAYSQVPISVRDNLALLHTVFNVWLYDQWDWLPNLNPFI